MDDVRHSIESRILPVVDDDDVNLLDASEKLECCDSDRDALDDIQGKAGVQKDLPDLARHDEEDDEVDRVTDTSCHRSAAESALQLAC